MNSKVTKVVIVVGLIVAVGVVLAIKNTPNSTNGTEQAAGDSSVVTREAGSIPAGTDTKEASTTGTAMEGTGSASAQPASEMGEPQPTTTAKALPRLVDLGANKCVACKMMEPVLEQLREEYRGRLRVDFYDVWQKPEIAQYYKIRVIPTQIFFDPQGKELFRHEGFFSKEDILAKWKELGFDLRADEPKGQGFERLVPATPDTRPRETVCYMCDKDIPARTQVVVQTEKGAVRLCSPHCYFILYSSLTEDTTGFEKRVTFTDWATGKSVAATEAVFLVGEDEQTGRPWIKAFADRSAAMAERGKSGGNLLKLAALQEKELSHRCGFCDRACYPQDAARVLVAEGLQTWGCCSHCALGVAARTGKDIVVHERDRLTGEPIVVKVFDGKIASLEPSTAVAWFGLRKRPDGTWGSAGCFHQGFFTTPEHLRQWVAKHPYETGRMIPIAKALADKMKLTPAQIQKACKIGECAPKADSSI